jgi:hypothetical protein
MVQQSQMYRLVHLRIGHREDRMKGQDKLMLFVFGVLFWVLGTLYYRLRGHVVLEVSSLRYWSNFVLVPVASAAVCILILRALHIPAREWAAAMLLIALPGMFGEAALLTRFSAFMPHMRAETGGRYGALLFASYALALSIAEAVSLRGR